MLLQPVIAGLPGGPQADKEKIKQNNKQTKNKTKYMHTRPAQWVTLRNI